MNTYLLELKIDKLGTSETLALMIFKAGLEDYNENLERTLKVLQLMAVVKKLGVENLERLWGLLWGYLVAGRKGEDEGMGLWDVMELEQDVFEA